MTTVVVKVARDRDLYVGWSTGVEAPVMFGDRSEMTRMLHEDLAGRAPAPGHSPEERLARADQRGTSAVGGFAFFGAWDDEGLVLEQRGVLPRGRLGDAVDWWMSQGPDRGLPSSFLEPFEDLGVVRPPHDDPGLTRQETSKAAKDPDSDPDLDLDLDPERRARFGEVLRRMFLEGGGEDLGPATRAYLEAKVEQAGRDGEVTFDAEGLHAALVEDSPDVARLDDRRAPGSGMTTGAFDPEDRP